jgi:hypothetical protein
MRLVRASRALQTFVCTTSDPTARCKLWPGDHNALSELVSHGTAAITYRYAKLSCKSLRGAVERLQIRATRRNPERRGVNPTTVRVEKKVSNSYSYD